MTAPGQEPDEVMTAKPGGKNPTDDVDLSAIGDDHMPQDVRERVREQARDPEQPEVEDRSSPEVSED